MYGCFTGSPHHTVILLSKCTTGTLDTAVVWCTERFQDGLQMLQKLQDISWKIDAVLDENAELNAMALEVQVKMFHAN